VSRQVKSVQNTHRDWPLAEGVQQRRSGAALVRHEVDAVDYEESALHPQRHELLLGTGPRDFALVHQAMGDLIGQPNAE